MCDNSKKWMGYYPPQGINIFRIITIVLLELLNFNFRGNHTVVLINHLFSKHWWILLIL